MEGLKYIFIISLLNVYVHAGDPIIDTTTGKIKGTTISVQNVSVDVFLGIPFAKPPVGDLRFRRPEPIEQWSGIKVTKEYAPSCVQVIEIMIEEFKIKTNISEDCLYLNIWAPTEARNSSSNLTTMIWIHGGGFEIGSSAMDIYDGRWLATSQNIIVVSLNYRIGSFGFLSLNDKRAPGNMGLLDQYLAIKWIRDNIASFGGNPDKLTLFGESAGGMSVSMHLISPISRKLFKNAIIMSGTANTDWVIRSNKENIDKAKQMAGVLKCPTDNDKLMLDCFLKADAEELAAVQLLNRTKFIEFSLSPIIDKYFLQKKPNEILKDKTIKKDVLIGFVKNEGSLFLPEGFPKYFDMYGTLPINKSNAHDILKEMLKPMQLNSEQSESIFYVYGSHVDASSQTEKYRYIFDQIAGDVMFKCPSIKYSQELSSHSNVYMYSFEYRSRSTPWPEWMGVIHASEIEYAFSRTLFGKNNSEDDKFLSHMVSSYFANFSKSGNPNNGDCSDCTNVPWLKFTPESQNYLRINKESEMSFKYTSTYNKCGFWSDLLPSLKERTSPEPTGGSQNTLTFQGRILTSFTSIFLSLMLLCNIIF